MSERFFCAVPPPLPQGGDGPSTAKRWLCSTKTSWIQTEYDTPITTSELFCSLASPTVLLCQWVGGSHLLREPFSSAPLCLENNKHQRPLRALAGWIRFDCIKPPERTFSFIFSVFLLNLPSLSFPLFFLPTREWYRRNFTITMLMARVALHNMWRAISERKGSKNNNTPNTWWRKKFSRSLNVFAVLFWGGFLSSAHMTFRELEKALLLLQLLMCADWITWLPQDMEYAVC